MNGIMDLVRAGVTGIKKNNLHRQNAAQGRQATDEHRQVMMADDGSEFLEDIIARQYLVERGRAHTSNMVMVRPIAEKHGGQVSWRDNRAIVHIPGHFSVEVVNAPIVNDRMLVDVEFFSKYFDIQALHEPGDRFETLLEAVHAWALTYHPRSDPTIDFPDGSEFGSWIYIEGGSFIFDRPWRIRGENFTIPWRHAPGMPVAWIHTHPRNYAGRGGYWDGRNFSWQDSMVANNRQIPAFLVSPYGFVLELKLGRV